MRDIDEDTITQAVIARHASAGEPRLRDVMTSLVQHLHAFARDVRLTEAEWAAGLRLLGECAQPHRSGRPDVVLLSDALGLSRLVMALRSRRGAGATEPAFPALHTPMAAGGEGRDVASSGIEPCFVFGHVRSVNGAPLTGAEVRTAGAAATTRADGAFRLRTITPDPAAPLDGPVARLLRALGREAVRPDRLHIKVMASGHEPLTTEIFRRGDPRLDADALFGARPSLLAEWVRHGSGPMPDGTVGELSFTTVEFDFVLTPTGDK